MENEELKMLRRILAEEEGKEEIANGLNEQVENEGEFYEGVHDN